MTVSIHETRIQVDIPGLDVAMTTASDTQAAIVGKWGCLRITLGDFCHSHRGQAQDEEGLKNLHSDFRGKEEAEMSGRKG